MVARDQPRAYVGIRAGVLAQHRHDVEDLGETDLAIVKRVRIPRSRRCTHGSRAAERPASRASQPLEMPRGPAARRSNSMPCSNRKAGPLLAADPASSDPARSEASYPAASTARESTHRRTAPWNARSTADARRHRSDQGPRRTAGGPPAAPSPCSPASPSWW